MDAERVTAPPAAAEDSESNRDTEAQQEAADKTTQASPEPEMVSRVDYAALQDQLLRLQADFENMRKRSQRERAELLKRANEEVVVALLPVLDNLDLALKNVSPETKNAAGAFVKGVQLVADQFMGVLKKFGLEPIEAHGQPFDHNKHESISMAPSDAHPEGTVVHQIRKGYMLGDRLLQAAQVVVSSGPNADEPTETSGKQGS